MSNGTLDEFETVKELLASAARYAESAHRGLDRLEATQQRTEMQIDRLGHRMEELSVQQEQQHNGWIVAWRNCQRSRREQDKAWR